MFWSSRAGLQERKEEIRKIKELFEDAGRKVWGKRIEVRNVL